METYKWNQHACSDGSWPEEDFRDIGGWDTINRCPPKGTASGRNGKDQRKSPGDRQLHHRHETKPSTKTLAEKQETPTTDNKSDTSTRQEDKDDPWTALNRRK